MDQQMKSKDEQYFNDVLTNRKSVFMKQAVQVNVPQRQSLKPKSNGSSEKLMDFLDLIDKQLSNAEYGKYLSVAIRLLFQYEKCIEAQQFICEQIQAVSNSEIEQFLLQLVFIMIKFNSDSLEKMLLSKCCESIALYLQIKWLYESFTQSDRQQGKNQQRVDRMDQLIEEAMVNGLSGFIFDDEQENNTYMDKINRSDYTNSIHIFTRNLVELSLNLKIIPVPYYYPFYKLSEQRALYLKKQVIKANRALVGYRLNNQDVIYCEGIIIPFPNTHSTMVVRVIETECQTFKTKKRVPYKIIIETIEYYPIKLTHQSIQELKTRDSLKSSQSPLGTNDTGTIIQNFMEQSHKDIAAYEQIIETATNRFNQIYPTSQNIVRASSCRLEREKQDQIINYKNKLNGFRCKYIQRIDIQTSSRIQFFDQMISEYPEKSKIIQHIKTNLGFPTNSVPLIQQQQLTPQSKRGPFMENWQQRVQQERERSPWGEFSSYRLRAIIVKGGDDLRQELMVMQMLRICERAFKENGTGLFMQTYDIIVTSESSGILEFCTETISLDALKKQMRCMELRSIYDEVFGDCFEEAQKNFIDSLAAYSLVQYLFQIKDRHNGNILVNSSGHLIHIDFGFILSVSPGGVNFENVPFKLTKEYVDLMDGCDSDMFLYFTQALFRGYSVLRSYVEEFIQIVQVMRHESDLPCFKKFDIKVFRERFMEKSTDEQLMKHVNKLIIDSKENSRTVLYDSFQKLTNGITP